MGSGTGHTGAGLSHAVDERSLASRISGRLFTTHREKFRMKGAYGSRGESPVTRSPGHCKYLEMWGKGPGWQHLGKCTNHAPQRRPFEPGEQLRANPSGFGWEAQMPESGRACMGLSFSCPRINWSCSQQRFRRGKSPLARCFPAGALRPVVCFMTLLYSSLRCS